MPTRLSSCARLGLARLVTTAVVCGAAVLFLPSPCDGAVASDVSEPGATVAPDEIAGQLPGSSEASSQAMTRSARFPNRILLTTTATTTTTATMPGQADPPRRPTPRR